MAVDAAMVNQAIGSPYAMFVLLRGHRGTRRAPCRVAAKDIVMVYKGQEYPHAFALGPAQELWRRDPGPGFLRAAGQGGDHLLLGQVL
ncbi:MAG: hypothetical protein MZV64_33755 [Ignavibacteriales bacterium]|nr:hypothetical protein [Ignavibacteriales bacterium]